MRHPVYNKGKFIDVHGSEAHGGTRVVPGLHSFAKVSYSWQRMLSKSVEVNARFLDREMAFLEKLKLVILRPAKISSGDADWHLRGSDIARLSPWEAGASLTVLLSFWVRTFFVAAN